MTQQILMIHGGNAFKTHEEYISYLQNKEFTLKELKFKDWKANLAEDLGSGHEVFTPRMPNSQNARYAEWKIWFEKVLSLLDDNLILIGHSLGGICIAKYLSENTSAKKIKATFLVAAPFNTAGKHPLVDFIISNDISGLADQVGQIFLYHSEDDKVVPYSNFKDYTKALPMAEGKIFIDAGHFHQTHFPQLVEDIKSLN